MHRLLAILIMLAASAYTEPPPIPQIGDPVGVSGTTTNTVTTSPWLMATGVGETGELVLEKPPQWMLDGPKTNAPTQTTIRLTFYDRMDTNALYHFEYTTPARQAFLKGEVIEK